VNHGAETFDNEVIHNTGTLGAIITPTLNNNSAGTGGGIFSSNDVLSITNGTVSGNTAIAGKCGGVKHSGAPASISPAFW